MGTIEFNIMIDEFVNYYAKEKSRDVANIVLVTQITNELKEWFEREYTDDEYNNN